MIAISPAAPLVKTCIVLFLLFSSASGQVDEVREATGLPIPIGTAVIYGQVAIRNFPAGERRPSIYVYLREGGTQIDKYLANDKGYWYFLRTPVDGQTLTVEVDGQEVGRVVIVGSTRNSFRQDLELDWRHLRGARTSVGPSVVSTRDAYPREKGSERTFQDALAKIREARAEEALKILDAMIVEDPQDFNAWLVVGTIHQNERRVSEARKAYSKAIDLKSDYFLANLNLGRLELSEKNFEAAIRSLTKAVELDGASANANHLLGEAYLQIKRGSVAEGYLRKAIELAPVEKAGVHRRLAALYHGAGLKGRAAAEYRAYLDKVKDPADRKKLEQYISENLPKS